MEKQVMNDEAHMLLKDRAELAARSIEVGMSPADNRKRYNNLYNILLKLLQVG